MPQRILILIRHAERKPGSSALGDPGLSTEGREQAMRLSEYFAERFPSGSGPAPRVLSSPKRRCKETLKPLAAAAGAKVVASRLLDEGAGVESRALEFARSWETGSDELVIACSHGDWIPVVADYLIHFSFSPATASWLEIVETEPGLVKLGQAIQRL